VIHHLEDVRHGYDTAADVVVVGSGAGGAAAALALAQAGMRVVIVEAGPQVKSEQMTRNGPAFLSKYYWEGGIRMLLGSGTYPAMSGRALGGSTVVNSAIMFRLPDWVREEWISDDGLTHLNGPAMDLAFDRVFERLKVAPTPMEVMGRKNTLTRDVLDHAGVPNGPLPRAVHGCRGSGNCLTGCAAGAKQSVDRSYLPDAYAAGARAYTCSHVDRVMTKGTQVTGVVGHVVDPDSHERLATFRVHAPRVFMAAGALHTPVLLQQSGITLGGKVGGTFQAHLAGVALGVMPEPVRAWEGATQGWGGFSNRVKGMKYEALWGPASLMSSEFGAIGPMLGQQLPDFEHLGVVVLVYRGNVRGSVRAKRNGMPMPLMWVPKEEAQVVARASHGLAMSFLDLGARYVTTGVRLGPERIARKSDADGLLSSRVRGRHLTMTCNHMFGSCRMSADPDRSVVDLDGRVRGVDGLWITDASVFPSPSAVNPQATVMAMADLTARKAADVDLLAPNE